MAEERRFDDEQGEDIEAREYTDEEGKVHQHTKKKIEDMEDSGSEDDSNE